MTPTQKSVIRKLLELSYDNGFHWFPLSMTSDLPLETLYDKNTETGELYEISRFGKGYIDIDEKGFAHVNFDLKDQLDRWTR
jgi:hypothetical protein